MTNIKKYLHQRLKSFSFAIKGMQALFKGEPNVKIHLFFAVITLALAFFFDVEKLEWIILIACITLVLAAEAFNTAIESLTDLSSPDYHLLAEKTKDIAAAAVLISAIGSAIIGFIIFVPYCINYFN